MIYKPNLRDNWLAEVLESVSEKTKNWPESLKVMMNDLKEKESTKVEK